MLFLFMILILADPQDTPPTTKIDVTEYGLQMTFPADWEARTEGVEPMLAVGQNNKERALTLIAVNPATMKDNDKTHLDNYLDVMKQNFQKFEIKSRGKTTVAGLEALHAVYVGSQGNVSIQYHAYSFHKHGDQFMITFAASPDKFEKMEPQFKSILQSLRLEGKKYAKETMALLAETKKKQPDYTVMEKLLKDGANIDGIGQDKMGALFSAVRGRNGKLVKWLISKEINLNNPRQDITMITLMATPAIRTLLHQAMGKTDVKREVINDDDGQRLEIQWVTKEAQLFAGIHNGKLEDVIEALKKGADPKAKDDVYKLQPLPLIKQIISEFEELELEAAKYHAIRKYLEKNMGS